jgi:hypothetical protein
MTRSDEPSASGAHDLREPTRCEAVIIDRRVLWRSIGGAVLTVAFANAPSIRVVGMLLADPEYLIINGWLLTREDMAADGLVRDVV